MALYILTLTFLDSRRDAKTLWAEWQQAFPKFSLLLISSWIQFWSVSVVPKYLNFAMLSKDLFPIFMLCLCPAFWHLDTNIYLVFSGFTSRPTSLLASNRAFVFLRGIYVFSHYINIISIGQKLMCPIQYQSFPCTKSKIHFLVAPNNPSWSDAVHSVS
jgi:hypothetical protein